MEQIMMILIGIFVAVGTYLVLSRNMIRIILGTAVLSHAIHLLILTVGGLKIGDVPLLDHAEGQVTDALHQALILTAIVISFATTAFLLVLSYRTYQANKTDNFEELSGISDE